jgi:hypothetical protein
MCVESPAICVRTRSAVKLAGDSDSESDSRTISVDKCVVIRSDRYLNVWVVIYTNGIREILTEM